VTCERDEARILDNITWTVQPGERWVVLGPNGSGKTTLLRIAALRIHPTAGEVEVAGHRLGTVDIRAAWPHIGWTSAATAELLRPALTAHEVVLTALRGALEPWWHTYDDTDHARARSALERLHATALADRTFGTLSSGERQRVLLARTLVTDPAVLLLDEPAAGLDLGSREELVTTLATLAADPTIPPLVLVTHHLEEIPPGITHALLLRDGRIDASGPLAEVLTSDQLSRTFGLDLAVEATDDRWTARAR